MNTNPFSVPNFSSLGDTSNNPLLRSMDMMAQAWKNMAAGGSADMGSAVMGQLDPDELERRIRDMRAVESWLQLNLSMLSASIQGLEIQRSTLTTLHNLAKTTGQANPFDAFMAMNPLAGVASHTEPSPSAQQKAEPQASAASPSFQDTAASAQQAADAMAEAGATAQGWWNMLQQQFESLAAASLKQAEALRPSPVQAASGDSTMGARPTKEAFTQPAADAAAGKAPAREPAKPATETVTRKRPAKKAASKSAAAK